MRWAIDYFEQENGIQPAEVFEDELHRLNKRMLGKLLHIQDQLKHFGYQLGGGYIEKCHDYQGLWEIRIIHSNQLIRELLALMITVLSYSGCQKYGTLPSIGTGLAM